MSTTRLTWTGTRAALEAIEAILEECLVPAADALSLVKDDPVEADEGSSWHLHAYFEHTPDVSNVTAVLSALEPPTATPAIETLEDRDWVAHALEGLGIVEAGGFVLFGSHDAERAAKCDGHPIQIEANRAFGTGHHPTTAGCLSAIAECPVTAPSRILDLGTGSGILAIAARRLWPDAAILGTDIDDPSIEIALENAELNGIGDITFRVANGVSADVVADGPFDVILANILADPLITLSRDIVASLAPGGTLILAGLLERQKDAVCEAYRGNGMDIVATISDGTWPVLRLSRAA